MLVLLAVSAVCAQNTEEKTYEISGRDYPFYISSVEQVRYPFPLYFINGDDDIPYLSLRDLLEMLESFYISMEDTGYDLTLDTDGTNAALVRENGFRMDIDFEADTITFDDYNAFLLQSTKTTLMDVLVFSGFDQEGEASLFQRNKEASFSRYGDMYTVDLSSYGIDLVTKDGEYYLPLQTVSDILVAPSTKMMLLFNGEALILANGDMLGNAKRGFTPLGELYYSAEPGERSEALAEFGYNELCMALDNLYGLKEIHDIESFDQIFRQIAYDQLLKGQDSYYADEALNAFIGYYLDDLHSSFKGYSWQVGPKEFILRKGPATNKMYDAWDVYNNARSEVYGGDIIGYEEVGNTAYITFDTFIVYGDSEDYYGFREGEEIPPDTIGLVIEAHDQITRENSPIENVVIDLSNNTGGMADAAIYLLGWLLGDASVTIKDMSTGALDTSVYRSDVNLDHQFDEKDTVQDKKIFCLISPVSFSCGNLVPSVLKASDKIILLGRTSAGGSCVIQNLSTAWGTLFQISGSSRLSFLKNGSFYDIDQGASPDYLISSPELYYDREALTEFINNIY